MSDHLRGPTAPDVSDPGRLIAHRGASHVAPENTIAAFAEAGRQGVRWVEFDVSLLGDGTPVIHHDGTLDRCTDASGPLSSIGLADLAEIDAGARKDPRYAGERIPVMEDALDWLGANGFHANLEIKTHGGDAEHHAALVAAALDARPWTRDRVIVSSFTLDALEALRRRMPDQPLAVLWHAPPVDWARSVMMMRAAAVHVSWTSAQPHFLADAAALGVSVRLFTVNDPDAAAVWRQPGLTGVISDHPPLFRSDDAWSAWLADKPLAGA